MNLFGSLQNKRLKVYMVLGLEGLSNVFPTVSLFFKKMSTGGYLYINACTKQAIVTN
jgi:hypothetical protein